MKEKLFKKVCSKCLKNFRNFLILTKNAAFYVVSSLIEIEHFYAFVEVTLGFHLRNYLCTYLLIIVTSVFIVTVECFTVV